MVETVKHTGAAIDTMSSGNTKATAKPLRQAQDIAGQAMAAGRDLKDRVAGLAGSSAEAVKSSAADFADVAKDFAAQAGETLKDRANEQKNAGAAYVGTIAESMRRAASEFDDELPIAGVYIRKAASRIEEISDTVQNGDIQDLVRGAQDFARRQPTAFLGLAVLAGFGAIRFLKSSGGTRDDDRFASSNDDDATSPPQRRGKASSSNRGHRDEYTS